MRKAGPSARSSRSRLNFQGSTCPCATAPGGLVAHAGPPGIFQKRKNISRSIGIYRIFNEFGGSLDNDNATETLLDDIGVFGGSPSYLSVANFAVQDIKFVSSFSDVEKDESTVIFSNTLRIQFTLK